MRRLLQVHATDRPTGAVACRGAGLAARSLPCRGGKERKSRGRAAMREGGCVLDYWVQMSTEIFRRAVPPHPHPHRYEEENSPFLPRGDFLPVLIHTGNKSRRDFYGL